MKKYFPAGLIIAIFTFLNFSTYLVGLSHTPPGMVFTGAVHYPPDYYYYLSLISQGATRWFTNYNLFTAESTMPQLIGWYYTLAGHLLLPIFRSPVIIYQLLTIGGSLLYPIAAYVLIKKLLPQHDRLQLLVFILFLISSTMPKISFANGHWNYSYVFAWYNLGDPFERLTNIPHHLLSEAGTMIIFILAFDWWKKRLRTPLALVVLALLGFTVASIQPVWWILVTIVLAVAGSSLLPALIVGLSGLPFVLYLRFFLYLTPQHVAWWSLASAGPAAQIPTTIWGYIIQNGPLVVTAILGLPFWFRHMTREKFALTFMTACSLLLFFSPLPARFGVLNIRILSVMPTLFFASVTGFFLWRLLTLIPKLKGALVFCIALLIGLTIALDMQLLTVRNYLFVQNNAWDYLSADVIRAYAHAATISRPNDMFLVFFPFDASFVGLTGRRIYNSSYANPARSANFEEKQKLADAFMNGTMPEAQQTSFLHKNNITHILTWVSAPPSYPGLTTVYKNSLLAIYKVSAL